jgi:hypothetical protein
MLSVCRFCRATRGWFGDEAPEATPAVALAALD